MLNYTRSIRTAAETSMSMQRVSEAVESLVNVSVGGAGRELRAVTAAAMVAAAGVSSADASIVRDPYATWDPFARAQGVNYLAGGSAIQGGGALALRIDAFDQNGVPNGTRNTSAIFLGNYYDPAQGGLRALCVTAEHNIADFYPAPMVQSSIRTGSNFNTNPGQTLNVTQWIQGDNSASRVLSRPDYSFFWLDGTIAGNNAVLGTANVGENLALVGFGRSGSQSMGSIPIDGNVRAVFLPKDSRAPFFGFSNEFYDQGDCRSSLTLPGLGRSQSGDSGAPVFNMTTGALVGMNVAGTNGTNLDGVSIYMDFTHPTFLAQYQSLAVVPTPATAALLGLAGVYAARRRRE